MSGSDRFSAGMTFQEEEIRLLAQLVEGICQSRDVRPLTRAKAFATVARKVHGMSARLEADKLQRAKEAT